MDTATATRPDVSAILNAMSANYIQLVQRIERLHRKLMELISDELGARGENNINSTQAFLLFNLGDNEVSARELRTRGFYLGANVTYNKDKLVDAGFIDQRQSTSDGRAIRLKLTVKGLGIRKLVEDCLRKQASAFIPGTGLNAGDLAYINEMARRIEEFVSSRRKF